MKKIFSIIMIVLLFVFLAGCQAKTSERTDVAGTPETKGDVQKAGIENIEIKGFAFNPVTLTIKKGTKVIWTNQDSVQHNVISDEGTELGSPLLSNGEQFTYVFNKEGTYAYHCNPHPRMKATIIVE